MTHQYAILTGGTILPHGADGPRPDHEATAIAWAEDTVLAVGSDEDLRAMSRGDSEFADLRGAYVVPVGAPLEVGSRADFRVLDGDPAGPTPRTALAVVRGGRVVAGGLAGIGHQREAGADHDA